MNEAPENVPQQAAPAPPADIGSRITEWLHDPSGDSLDDKLGKLAEPIPDKLVLQRLPAETRTIDDSAWASLAQWFCQRRTSKVPTLKLIGFELSDAAWTSFVTAFAQCGKAIGLFLRNVPITASRMTDFCKTLTASAHDAFELGLSRNGLTTPAIAALAEPLAKNKLATLRIVGNGVTEAALAPFAAALGTTTRLRLLCLNQNPAMTDAGAARVFGGLMSNGSCKTLLMDNCGITQLSTPLIDSLMRSCKTLVKTSFDNPGMQRRSKATRKSSSTTTSKVQVFRNIADIQAFMREKDKG